jgi:hypothetical protein
MIGDKQMKNLKTKDHTGSGCAFKKNRYVQNMAFANIGLLDVNLRKGMKRASVCLLLRSGSNALLAHFDEMVS